jgi:putative glycosyltransferase (TIGR04348 family)
VRVRRPSALILTPARPGSTLGNAVTARRYAGFLRSAGWRVTLARRYRNQRADLLVALHARRSARSVLAFCRRHPGAPVIVVLTGTDVYRDLGRRGTARQALAALRAATHIVALQPLAMRRLSPALRRKAISIIQSAAGMPAAGRTRRHRPPRSRRPFRVCVVGHLRTVKDPLRVAYALRHLPRDLPVRIVQAGAALEPRYARAARHAMRRDTRYRWLGPVSHMRALRLLASSDVTVVSSLLEGGANVVCEAIAQGVPILASKVDGNVGLLGGSYPGYFPVRDTAALAKLLMRAATKPDFLARLRRHVRRLRRLVTPRRERQAWLKLVRNVCSSRNIHGKRPPR